jgi:transposase-like protein
LSESERAESKRLRKESAQLRIDNEILRKAAAYFAPETNR